MAQSEASNPGASASLRAGLDKFDHVVVLMLENRSFDNLLGFLHADGVPSPDGSRKEFDGVTTSMSNPIPADAVNQPPDGSKYVHVAMTRNYHQPYPDPGEEYYHVNVQLYNQPNGGAECPFNLPLPTPNPPEMQGFVTDYIEKLGEKASKLKGKAPTVSQYSQIMECFDPEAVPVLSTLAKNFGVFDHWYCSVPSQTWCNRAFWNAGTSWGRVNQEPYGPWFDNNHTTTIFNQISNSKTGLSWNVYHDTALVSLTYIIHFGALVGFEKQFHPMDRFFDDCKNGKLPSYSFLEPDFIFQHNDYHPSSAGLDIVDPKTKAGSVLLGEHLVAKVYDAIKGSKGDENGRGNTSQNTLLIITFDEHGGTFDHAAPLSGIKPPDLDGLELQECFDFKRSGIRVPTIMVSAHIAPNTIVNTPLMHTAFLNTMQAKWADDGDFGQISQRQDSDGMFTEVFTAIDNPRPGDSWPPVTPPPLPSEFEPIQWDELISELGQSIVDGLEELLKRKLISHSAAEVVTLEHARDYFAEAKAKLEELL